MLYMQGTFRLERPTVAIDRSGPETSCYQVPEGALLIVAASHQEGSLVEVFYAGRRLLMFENDLRDRARPVNRPATA